MTTTSTIGSVITQLVDQMGIGIALPSWTGTTTTLTLANSYLEGPFTAARIPIGSPIIVTAGGTVGDMTYVSNYVPSTGVITVSPAITTGSTDGVLITDTEIDRPIRIVQAVRRAIDNRIARWQMTPLTFVADGDLRGATVTDYWTGTAATPTYVTPTFPTTSAGVSTGIVGIQRVLQSVTSNATNNVRSNLINVALNSSVTGYQWYFQTAIRVSSGSGNAQILAWDETNNAQITVNVIAGSDSFTHVTTSAGFINMEGTFNIPATCKQISFRLVSSATSTTIQMAPLVAFPVTADRFPIPNRIISQDYIGNFKYAWPTLGTGGMYDVAFTEPITSDGLEHHIDNYGDHMTVTFNFRPHRAVWFEELAGDDSAAALTTTTTFPLNQLYLWSKFELLDWLWGHEKMVSIPYGNRAIPSPSRWLAKRNAALRAAQNSEFEPKAVTVVGRR